MMDDSVRQAPLVMDGATFRALGHRLVDQGAFVLRHKPVRSITSAIEHVGYC